MPEKALVPIPITPPAIPWTPPIIPSPQGARQFLRFLLWEGAVALAQQWIVQGDIEAKPWDVPVLFAGNNEKSVERRAQLYTVTVQRINALEYLTESALAQLLWQVREEGVHALEGWAGVTGWALSLRNGYSPNGGFWWTLGQIIDFVLPYAERWNVVDNPARFFDTGYLHRIGVVVPKLTTLIKSDHDPLATDQVFPDNTMGGGDVIRAVRTLLEEAETESKQALMDKHQAHRYDKMPAWTQAIDDGVLVMVHAPDIERAEATLSRLKSLVDYQGPKATVIISETKGD
jgi:hypothetical protein